MDLTGLAGRAAHGASRLVAMSAYYGTVCSSFLPVKSARLCGPLHPPQRRAGGRPLSSPALVWSAPTLRALLAPFRGHPQMPVKPGDIKDLLVWSFGPARLAKTYGRYEIFHAALTGRNRGEVVAVYDSVTDSHRWVLETRNAVVGSLRWLGRWGKVAYALVTPSHPAYRMNHGQSIAAVNLSTGVAHQVLFPGQRRDLEADGDVNLTARLVRGRLLLRWSDQKTTQRIILSRLKLPVQR